MDRSRITIIVLNWNLADETIACLESLADADLGGASVFVVDNGSTDDSVAKIRSRFPDIRIVALPENRGYAGGNNAGIRVALEAGAEGVLLLNNDVRVAADFLPPLVAAMESDPLLAAVSSAPMRMDRPEMLDVAYIVVDWERRDAVRTVGVNALPGEGFDARRYVQVATGCSVLLSADALRAVGLYNEEFFAYHEDVDWCLRAGEKGYRVAFEPYSRVLHRGSRSTAAMQRTVPASGAAPDLPDLPNAEPLPWNPVRTYLGARNLVRLLRAYANRAQRATFVRLCVQEIPLELLAAAKNRRGWLRLGRWGYKDFLHQHFIAEHRSLNSLSKPVQVLAHVVWLPIDLVWRLPRDIWKAYRAGQLDELTAYLRGLRDGWLNRPIPFARLGLR